MAESAYELDFKRSIVTRDASLAFVRANGLDPNFIVGPVHVDIVAMTITYGVPADAADGSGMSITKALAPNSVALLGLIDGQI